MASQNIKLESHKDLYATKNVKFSSPAIFGILFVKIKTLIGASRRKTLSSRVFFAVIFSDSLVRATKKKCCYAEDRCIFCGFFFN